MCFESNRMNNQPNSAELKNLHIALKVSGALGMCYGHLLAHSQPDSVFHVQMHAERGVPITLNHVGSDQVGPTPRMPGASTSPNGRGEPENLPPSGNGSYNSSLNGSGSYGGESSRGPSPAAPPPPSFGDAASGA
jgi:hypothetical protein